MDQPVVRFQTVAVERLLKYTNSANQAKVSAVPYRSVKCTVYTSFFIFIQHVFRGHSEKAEWYSARDQKLNS